MKFTHVGELTPLRLGGDHDVCTAAAVGWLGGELFCAHFPLQWTATREREGEREQK